LAEVVWTEEADRWLLKIHDYIAPQSPQNAFTVVESVYRRAQILATFPDLGHRHTTTSGREVRILLWGHYRIVYHRPKEEEVHILGVFHGAMTMPEYLE